MGRRGREKFGAGSASRRRTVLQIESVSRRRENEGSHVSSRKREINPTSISGIGLLGQYAENSDNEDEKNYSTDEENMNDEDQTKPSKEIQIDSKLSDFFKEIEAISTEDSKATELSETRDDTTTVDESTQLEPAEASSTNQNLSGYVVPSPWQQVCDPSTNYIYYWNTLTNEVSWELPQTYGAIQTQPAVEQMAQDTVVQQEVVGYTEKESVSLAEDQSISINEETKDTVEGAEGETIVTDTAVKSPVPIETPATSTSEQPERETISSSPDGLVDDILTEKEREADQAISKSNDAEAYDNPKPEFSSTTHKREQAAAIDMFELEAEEDDLSQNEDEKKDILKYWDEERMKNAVPEEMPEYPPTPDEVSPDTSPDDGQPDTGIVLDAGREENHKDAFEAKERSEKEDTSFDEEDGGVPAKKAKFEQDSDPESEDFAEKLLEEFLEGKPADDVSSGDDMDVESDNGEQKNLEEISAPLLPPEAFVHNRADRLKDDGSNSPSDVSRSLVEVEKEMEGENEKITTEIHDLCQLLSNKLEFLSINKDGLNKLVILLIQMETRIKDWREGGLSSPYIVKKLREAAEDLKKYEQSAVPKEWSCHWDSTYKRYFYTNDKTGESQWDYPQTSTALDSSSVDTAKVPDNVAATESWDTSVIKENTSSNSILTPALDQSHFYTTNLANTAAYPIVATTSNASVAQVITSIGQTRETIYNMLAIPLDPDTNTAAMYSVAEAPEIREPTDVTKDPYRFDDDSPPGTDSTKEHDNIPPPPGLSPPPPPPADVQTVPPPPPPQDDVVNVVIPPPPPPVLPNVSENLKTNQVQQVGAATEKHGPHRFQRSLLDYSDLEGPVYQENTKVQTSASSRSSPVHVQSNTKQKKKKSKSSSVAIRTSKVKQMSSLVQKWQAIKRQEDVLSDESDEEDYAAKAEVQIEQWRQEQISSGLAADNPNFQKITGDWRERVRKAKLRAKTEQSGS